MLIDEKEIRDAVAKSSSFSETLSALSLDETVKNFSLLKKRVKELKISTAHFEGSQVSSMPTEEELRKAVAQCRNMSSLMRFFKKNPNSSGSRIPFEMMIDKLKIDLSHWKGKGSNVSSEGGKIKAEKADTEKV